jgi:hypothetical protein
MIEIVKLAQETDFNTLRIVKERVNNKVYGISEYRHGRIGISLNSEFKQWDLRVEADKNDITYAFPDLRAISLDNGVNEFKEVVKEYELE